MNKWSIVLGLLLVATSALGQMDDFSKTFEQFRRDQMQQYDTFKISQQAEYDAFRRAQNEQYATFMRDSWETAYALPAIVVEEEEELAPVVYEAPVEEIVTETASYSEAIITKEEVIIVPQPSAKPAPIAPVEAIDEIPHKTVAISLYPGSYPNES